MADVHSPERRSENMRAIGNKNTRPEITLRKLLFARGLRYRLHTGHLPGKPDIVLPKYRVAIFVHGCFWHRHDCYLFKWPQTRTAFWAGKLAHNAARDQRHVASLTEAGWRVLTVWECALKGRLRWDKEELVTYLETWIRTGSMLAAPAEVRHVLAAAAPPERRSPS
jgi:DNA mismatch endonuclease (patch repair protein)